jgi:hypothetical protein
MNIVRRFITAVTTDPHLAFIFGYGVCAFTVLFFTMLHDFTGWQPLVCQWYGWSCMK